MAALSVTLTGVKEAQTALRHLKEGAEVVGRMDIAVGSPLPYAYGIEYGRHRRGGLARRAGPARYLRGGLEAIERPFEATITKALPKGARFTEQALAAIARDLVTEAQRRAPERSGNLRRSIYAVVKR